ncbi:SNF2 family N-terminal domain-containing protein [Rhypophila decipiens]|uniref:SNF2 family N-terminal domain-containing protein n=1 Tax=Rhypophila decipiens TaxID=261697 RepID=A0AAN6XY99_9PEZI|nr:SNF2 family N-terminal domain-containing protein [Rhypophila decipiens]
MFQLQPDGSSCLKRPGAGHGSPELSPKRFRSSPNASDSIVGASPLSLYADNPLLEAQYALSDESHHPSLVTSPMATDMDSVMTDAPNDDDSSFYVDDDNDVDSICYGALLCEARLSPQLSGQLNLFPSDATRFRQFGIVRVGEYYALSTPDSVKPFAHLNRVACTALQQLDQLPNLNVEAIIESEKLKQIRSKSKSISAKPISITINIYGPSHLADQVGDALSEVFGFLQHPFFLHHRCQYFNPQMFRSGTEMQNLTNLVGLTERDFRAKALSDELERIFDESLGYIEPDLTGHSTFFSHGHQIEALGFIQSREDHNWCQAASRNLRDIAKIPPKDDIPSYATGGILADAMGLGKTLTMLSAIVSTVNHARTWALSAGNGVDNITTTEPLWRARATLIVVTSIQVLNVWETEIQKHIKPQALKTCMFHGKNRPTTPDQVVDLDIVLTTYGLLVSDFKNNRVLQNVDWYRVTLDEAHWIRNQGSDQFKAAVGLNSLRRWCLTGTPIQNRLDDLVSLLRFLHFEPFARGSVFYQHILEPLSKESPDRAFRLQALLRTVCLRRKETLLKLPEPRELQFDVDLDAEERLMYNDILQSCARDIDEVISSQVRMKRYSILFTAIMKLRRVCNHGILPVGINGSTPVSEAESEQDCEVCGGANEDRLGLVNIGDICPQCGKSLSTTSIQQSPDPSTSQASQVDIAEVPSAEVPQLWLPPLPELVPNPQQGLSTKLKAVVDNLEQSPPGSKSLVFSYWTATLDMLEHHLIRTGRRFLRMDGKVPYKSRLDILESFKTSADIPILLISIQTGAVGLMRAHGSLNLTVANYVHIIEPQWNPSVEEQAVGRAVRMGQERTVTIIRYINIVNLQRRKRSLAKFTLDTGTQSGDGLSGGLDDLKFVLDLDSA